MEIRLLGPGLRVVVGERQLDIGTLRERAVLAVLALTPGRVVPLPALIDRVWGADPPAKVRSSVYAYVARLRRRLRDASAGAVTVASRSSGYVLEAHPESVDWHRFRGLRDRAERMAGSGDGAGALRLLSEALEMWEDAPLAELDSAWAAGTRQVMRNVHQSVLAKWAQTALELGRLAEVIALTDDHGPRYPADEALARSRMEALARTGRDAEALQVYAGLREHLAETLGIDPGPRTRRLHESLLAGGGPPRAAEAPPEPPPVDNLPRDIGDFTARHRELAALTDRARAAPSATVVQIISGMPGLGKTTLALRAAHALRADFDVRVYLDLCGHSEGRDPLRPADALHTLLRVLGVPAEDIPAELQARASLWSTRIARRRALVVLDDAVHEQLAPLIPGARDCVVLITSRHRLTDVDGAHHLPLATPTEAEAAGMLTAIAGLDPAPEAGADLERVARICGRLPLALRIVAGQLRHRPGWDVAGLAERLTAAENPLSEMSTPNRDLAAAFALSLRSVGEPARTLLLLLGLHPTADFAPHAAVALTGWTPERTAAALRELADVCLVDEAESDRFRLHDLVRAFAARCAHRELGEGERRSAVVRLLDSYTDAVQTAAVRMAPLRKRLLFTPVHRAQGLDIPQGPAARDWFRAEFPRIRAAASLAADQGLTEHAARLPLAAAGLTALYGPWEQAVELHVRGLEQWTELGGEPERAMAAYELGWVQWRLRGFEQARRNAETALACWRRIGDAHGAAHALDLIGQIVQSTGGNEEAAGYHQAALETYRALGDRPGAARAQEHLGLCQAVLGDYRAAEHRFGEALRIHRDVGDRASQAMALGNIATVLLLRGLHRDARRMFEEVLAIFRELGDLRGEALALNNMADLAAYKLDHAGALAYARRAREIFTEIGDRGRAVNSCAGIAAAQTALGRPEEAREVLEHALASAALLGDPVMDAQLMLALGDAVVALDRPREAMLHYRSARRRARQAGAPFDEALAGERIGDLLAAEGDLDEAAVHWRAALSIAVGLRIPNEDILRIKLGLSENAGSVGA